MGIEKLSLFDICAWDDFNLVALMLVSVEIRRQTRNGVILARRVTVLGNDKIFVLGLLRVKNY